LVQAVKAIVADRLGRPGLALTRPPLEPLDEGSRRALLAELATLEREPILPAV
jgi:hypothetical protein